MDCSCYWGLLNKDFEFIYISKNMRQVGSQLGYSFIRSSLFHIIEPTCIPKFRRDLDTFKSIAGFNGVAIRIKARNFWPVYHRDLPEGYAQPEVHTPNYLTYSATMQVISPTVILALFHVDEDSLRRRNIHYTVRCFQHYDQEEINIIHASLENNSTSRRLPPLSSLHTSSATPSILSPSSPGFPPFQTESRSLLIYDSQAPQILLAWPPENFSRLTQQDALPSPLLGHHVLLDPRDSSRLLGVISSSLQENRLHPRINFGSEFIAPTGVRAEQILYTVGNITLACSQLATSERGIPHHANQLHPSKSMSFPKESFSQENSHFGIQRKISAPVLSSHDYGQAGARPINPALAKKRSTDMSIRHSYGLSRPKSSGVLVPLRDQESLAMPRKSFSNESFRKQDSPQAPAKAGSRLFSLFPSRALNLNFSARFWRGNSNVKPELSEPASSENTTVLPSISQLCPQSFSSHDREPDSPQTSLPGISQLLSSDGAPPCSPHGYPFHPSDPAQYTSMGRHMGLSHSSLGSTPLTSPLLTGPSRMCLACGTTASPEWRRGPKGQKTLCNACGLKYSRQLKAARLQNQPEYPTSQPS